MRDKRLQARHLTAIALLGTLAAGCGGDPGPASAGVSTPPAAFGSDGARERSGGTRSIDHPDFTGVWSGVFTTQQDDYWQLEDYACFVGCPPEAYSMYGRLLDDPANDERPLDELQGEMIAFIQNLFTGRFTEEGRRRQSEQTAANDTVMQCEPYGYVRQVTNPLPMVVREAGGNLVFTYEEWNAVRTVYMDGRGHPDDLEPSPMGHSIGYYDDDALVVETAGVEGDLLFSFMSGGSYTDQMTGTERYTLREDGQVLHVEFLYFDPVILTEPIMIEKSWIATPGLELLVDSCEDVAGQP